MADEVLTEFFTTNGRRGTNRVLSPIPRLNGLTLTWYWLAYKVLMVELCVGCPRTVGYINYKEYRFQVLDDKRPA